MADDVGLLLADTSAWHRSGHPKVAEKWGRYLIADRIATTAPIRLEVLFSAKSPDDYDQLALELDALHQLPCGAATFERALEVQRELAHHRPLHHRIALPDLLIAAVAEAAGAAVWHYDRDYDRIAEITGQPTIWIAPRGRL